MHAGSGVRFLWIVLLWQELTGMAGVVSAGRFSFQVGIRPRPRRAGSHRATHRRPPLGIGRVARPWGSSRDHFQQGLSWLHVHVEAEVSFCGTRSRVVGATRTGLYSAHCLQMYNLVLEGETDLRVCPSCGIRFVRQGSRASAK
jgi:hypothetical protein